MATRKPLALKIKESASGQTKVTMAYDDEELPPERAAELARREAELKRLIAGGTLFEAFRKKPR